MKAPRSVTSRSSAKELFVVLGHFAHLLQFFGAYFFSFDVLKFEIVSRCQARFFDDPLAGVASGQMVDFFHV